MPPKKKTQSSTSSSRSSSSKDHCCVCCQIITVEKDEALFCSGECQQWLHRYCAGVSINCYKELKAQANGTSFYCYGCSLKTNGREMAILKDAVESLKREVTELKSSLSSSQLPSKIIATQVCDTNLPCNDGLSSTSESTTKVSLSNPEVTRSSKEKVYTDRKYNIVLYGVDECAKGIPKRGRFESDLSKAVSILSGLDESIQSESIKDIYRLGKFSQEKKRPSPLLVKFIRVSDVSNVLSKRRLLKHPTFIKPDLNLEERKVESMLLKERWSLIQSGVPRSDIKIRDLRLFVKNKLHGQITNIGSQCTFTPHDSSQPSTTPDIHQANTHISSPIVSATPVAACAPPQSTTNTFSAALIVDITPQLVQSHSHCSLNASPSQSPNPVSGNDTGQTD